MISKETLKFKKNESFYIRDGWMEKAINTIKIIKTCFFLYLLLVFVLFCIFYPFLLF